jgi:hypothetical protein
MLLKRLVSSPFLAHIGLEPCRTFERQDPVRCTSHLVNFASSYPGIGWLRGGVMDEGDDWDFIDPDDPGPPPEPPKTPERKRAEIEFWFEELHEDGTPIPPRRSQVN